MGDIGRVKKESTYMPRTLWLIDWIGLNQIQWNESTSLIIVIGKAVLSFYDFILSRPAQTKRGGKSANIGHRISAAFAGGRDWQEIQEQSCWKTYSQGPALPTLPRALGRKYSEIQNYKTYNSIMVFSVAYNLPKHFFMSRFSSC